MVIFNIVKTNQNINLLKNIENEHTVKNGAYKGYQAPCVVFESDSGDVVAVAYTMDEYVRFSSMSESDDVLDEVRKQAIQYINDVGQAAYQKFEKKYMPVEIAFFEKSASEVLMCVANENISLSSTPLLTARSGNTTKEARNARAMEQYEIMMRGYALSDLVESTRNSVESATTQDEIDLVIQGFAL